MLHRFQNVELRATATVSGMLALLSVPPVFLSYGSPGPDRPTIAPERHLLAASAVDQDDMCIWLHPERKAESTIITSDKKADKVFVYGLNGVMIQELPLPSPGNIDVRYGFPLGGRQVDVVAVLQRAQGTRIVVFAVDPLSRRLRRVDDDSILTGKGKGGTLYHSSQTGKFYFFKTAEEEGHGGVEQYELADDGNGRVTGRKVRQWDLAGCESAVADDETGKLYLSEEDRGIWEVGAEPDDPVPGSLVIRTGDHGLVPDVEGLTVYREDAGHRYLLVSNQAQNEFKVFGLRDGPRFLGTFTLEGVVHPDGIDVSSAELLPGTPGGIFVTHSEQADSDQCPVLVASWESIARRLGLPAAAPVRPSVPELPQASPPLQAGRR